MTSTKIPTTIQFPALARVDGSASFGFGSSIQSLSSISGPIEVHPNSEDPSRATLEVLTVPLSGIPGIAEKKTSQIISNVLSCSLMLEKCPRSLVQLVVQAYVSSSTKIGHDDVLLASMINSSSLAALKAGSVPMRGVVCAVAVGASSSGPTVLDVSDPTAPTGGTFAFLFSRGKVESVYNNFRGGTVESLRKSKELAKTAADKLYEDFSRSFGCTVAALGEDEGSDDETGMEI